MGFVKQDKKNNRGETQKWHAGHVELSDKTKVYNCPCRGKEQAPRKQLVARQAQYDNNKLDSAGGFHRPGSQNRKK